jgi:hypothetical protein
MQHACPVWALRQFHLAIRFVPLAPSAISNLVKTAPQAASLLVDGLSIR